MDKNIKEVASVFFKLGCFAFGGPAAHISMMEQEVVEKRKWMTKEHFLDLIGVTNLIPGPNSTEMTMHCGHERAGKAGLFVAGLAFIIPAIIITGVLAWAYTTYGELPNIKPFIQGIQPTVIAIILAAVITLGKKALKTIELGV
ncbi:MAG: chromate transporter, partial [Bacteroidetes bacterium]|nr:chromate transporter [Bacteroidota bacterium]